MITMSFGEFAKGKYDTKNELHQLYVVIGDKDEVLYVGISKAGIWDRWFGWRGRMPKNGNGSWFPMDYISVEIVEHLPESLAWTIELWTLSDCLKLFTDVIKKIGYAPDRLDIGDCEKWMIEKRIPSLNVIHNYHA